ncbi:hypothetical protein IFM47457_06476 [Aspergillus lentulus]|nr:hypothetical protein IFM47457_06476 [Aspergillus lentulus]
MVREGGEQTNETNLPVVFSEPGQSRGESGVVLDRERYGALKGLDSSVHFDFHLLSAEDAAREHIFPVRIIMLGSMQCNLLSLVAV